LDGAAALAKAEAEADEQIVAAQERLMGELKRAVARWLMDAGWSSEQVEGFYTVHGESDGGAAGFYLLGCGRQPRPLLVERGGVASAAGSNPRNPRRQRAAHPPAGTPEPGADGGAPYGVGPSGARGRRRLDV
jgi:hypothetical protein